MQQIADNIYRLGTRGHNFFLIRDGDALTFVDAGCSGEWDKLVAGVESLGLALDAIAGIIATHSHSDHFGTAKEAVDHGVRVAVHRDEETRALGTYRGRYSATTKDLPKFNLHMIRNFIPMLRAGVMKLEHPASVETFVDGVALDLPGNPIPVHTPGHTEGHTMFHCPDQGLLFTGDGLATMDLLGTGKGPQMLDGRFHLDADQAYASLEKIVGIDAKLLLPGHGDPWQGTPEDAVALVRR